MPWTVNDVDSKKKGLTPKQKEKWIKIANGVLESCKGDTKSCEAKAIRIANSSFSDEEFSMTIKKETQKISLAAFRFQDKECFAKISEEEGQEKPKLDMMAYTGKIIKNHWYWNDLVIDLEGMKFSKSKYPILENHDTGRKIAFTGKPVVENSQLKINSEKTEFVDTPFAEEFIKLSKEGFPYESSIYAVPSAIERLQEGATAEVNGFTFKGPGTIWRQCEFKEASVCVFGWDTNTKASAFAGPEVEIDLEISSLEIKDESFSKKEVECKMNSQELKEKHPDVYTEIVGEVTSKVTKDLEERFSKEKTTLETSHKQREDELRNQMSVQDEKILELEKKDAIRSENELRDKGDRIWTEKLSNSVVPTHLYDKVQKHVSYTKFVKDGVLDVEAFGKAIDEEIKDWVDRGITASVLGSGFTKKNEDDSDPKGEGDVTNEEAEKLSNDLLGLAGQEQKK